MTVIHSPKSPAQELREVLRELTAEQLAALIVNSAMLKTEESAQK